jgi:hypothetical protein
VTRLALPALPGWVRVGLELGAGDGAGCTARAGGVPELWPALHAAKPAIATITALSQAARRLLI